jgi:hypothetical protein
MLDVKRRARLAFPIAVALAVFSTSVGTAAAADPHPSPPAGTCNPIIPFKPENFEHSTKIDNRYLPLVPGTQLTLEGRANTGGANLPHTVVFTVTDVVKRIDGVLTLTMWDRDINQNVLAEEELAFFAQDEAGNVWNLGEYPEELDNGHFTGAPNTWISGHNAVGGIHMLAHPQLGTPRYLQGFSPAIDFLDCAQVFADNQHTCVTQGCFDGVLVTDETSPLSDPNTHQRKFHAPGVGIVQVGAVNDPEGETLVLTKITHLDAAGRARANNAVLRLDRRGYVNSDVYRHTRPAFVCLPDQRGSCKNK